MIEHDGFFDFVEKLTKADDERIFIEAKATVISKSCMLFITVISFIFYLLASVSFGIFVEMFFGLCICVNIVGLHKSYSGYKIAKRKYNEWFIKEIIE